MTIELGWWLLPAFVTVVAFTVGAVVGLFMRELDGRGGLAMFALVGGGWSLAAWLVYFAARGVGAALS